MATVTQLLACSSDVVGDVERSLVEKAREMAFLDVDHMISDP